MNIYLIGPMGSGKSTAARALSRRLRWPWIDTDLAVSQLARLSISRIFRSRGENYFRRLERAAVALTAKRSGRIVAVGGGAVLAADNIAAMRRSGLVVYLQASPTACLNRVERDGIAARPLLAAHPPRRRGRVLARLLRVRRPRYMSASHIRVRAGDDCDRIADRIARRLRPLLQTRLP